MDLSKIAIGFLFLTSALCIVSKEKDCKYLADFVYFDLSEIRNG